MAVLSKGFGTRFHGAFRHGKEVPDALEKGQSSPRLNQILTSSLFLYLKFLAMIRNGSMCLFFSQVQTITENCKPVVALRNMATTGILWQSSGGVALIEHWDGTSWSVVEARQSWRVRQWIVCRHEPGPIFVACSILPFSWKEKG
jgi:hypothetical protein